MGKSMFTLLIFDINYRILYIINGKRVMLILFKIQNKPYHHHSIFFKKYEGLMGYQKSPSQNPSPYKFSKGRRKFWKTDCSKWFRFDKIHPTFFKMPKKYPIKPFWDPTYKSHFVQNLKLFLMVLLSGKFTL